METSAYNSGSLFASVVGSRPLVMDGAMGTSLLPHCGRGCPDALCLTHRGIVAAMHRAYLDAGADVITTNTFNANALSLRSHGLRAQVRSINKAAAAIARREAGIATSVNPLSPRYVAGVMGPTEEALSMPGCTVAAGTMEELFAEQAAALLEGGVDVLLIETVYDVANAVAAMRGVLKARSLYGSEIPFMLSATVTAGDHLPSGHTLLQLVEAAAPYAPLAIGLNCSDAAHLCRCVPLLADVSPYLAFIYPNAGLPDEQGSYPCSPESFAGQLVPLLASGRVAMAGGCCGTTPDYIRLLAHGVHGALAPNGS